MLQIIKKCILCPCINCKLCGCIIHNTTIFCSKRQCHFLYHIMAYSRRGEQCSPVKKCDTYGIIALFTNYKFIITTQGKVPI